MVSPGSALGPDPLEQDEENSENDEIKEFFQQKINDIREKVLAQIQIQNDKT